MKCTTVPSIRQFKIEFTVSTTKVIRECNLISVLQDALLLLERANINGLPHYKCILIVIMFPCMKYPSITHNFG